MTTSRRARIWLPSLALVASIVAAATKGAEAAGPHVARRVAAAQLVGRAGRAPANGMPSMRIGSLEDRPENAPAARRSAPLDAPAVRQGSTPAGGLTVEVGERFMTRIVLRADGRNVPQCRHLAAEDLP
jgi:hypothetical protein